MAAVIGSVVTETVSQSIGYSLALHVHSEVEQEADVAEQEEVRDDEQQRAAKLGGFVPGRAANQAGNGQNDRVSRGESKPLGGRDHDERN